MVLHSLHTPNGLTLVSGILAPVKIQKSVVTVQRSSWEPTKNNQLCTVHDNFAHRLSINIKTTICGFISAQMGVALVFIFQKSSPNKVHYGCLTGGRFQSFNLIFYSQLNVKLQGKIDKEKIGAFGTTFIAKICDSPWSSFIFLLSKVLEVRVEKNCKVHFQLSPSVQKSR
jgi:hypothetical protein